MIVLIAPLMKEINDHIHEKIHTSYASQEHHGDTKFIGTIQINIIYSFWLATNFHLLTVEIEYILLFINFCMNLSLCFKIVRLSGKIYKVHSDKNYFSGTSIKFIAIQKNTRLVQGEVYEINEKEIS